MKLITASEEEYFEVTRVLENLRNNVYYGAPLSEKERFETGIVAYAILDGIAAPKTKIPANYRIDKTRGKDGASERD